MRSLAIVRDKLLLLLDQGEGETPGERGARRADLCDAVSSLLQELMGGQPGWDSQFTWLDGILPDTIMRTGDGLRLVGGAVVVHGDRWNLRAIQANLVRPPGRSRIHFASADSEVPYRSHRRAGQPTVEGPPNPETWPYIFEVSLDP